MATCAHCGSTFEARDEREIYCCSGCEYVAELISGEGWEQFYDLKGSTTVSPLQSRPFEEHDFSWLGPLVVEAERTGGIASLDLGLEGISCVGCVWLIERLFERCDGGIRAVAHPASGRLHLEWVPRRCDLGKFLIELSRFGYVAGPTPSRGGDTERRRLSIRMGLCGGFALNTMAFSLPSYLGMADDVEFAGLFRMIAFGSATLSMLVGAGYFIGRAWRSLFAGTLHIDMPIALGLLVAYAGSLIGWSLGVERLVYFDFVSTFVFLMLGGRYVQTLAVERNQRRLLARQPVADSYGSPENDGSEVALSAIVPGVRFLLRSGQAMPVSGLLAEGVAEFSYAWIHGEADPVHVGEGARLPSGAILLGKRPVVVEADETWSESLLFRLVSNPERDRGSPGLERLLRMYLLVVLVIGAAAWVGWALAGDGTTGMQAMISVFVVSCPCALGVAIPLADDLAASAVTKWGVFVRTSSLWSRLVEVRWIVFDKTGTLTLEKPVLANPEVLAQLDDESAAALARLARGSLHPMSRSLMENLGRRGQTLLDRCGVGTRLSEVPGKGVSGVFAGVSWSLGRCGWESTDGTAGQGESGGGIGSELRREGRLVASFEFRDELRPGTRAAIDSLRGRGLGFSILSGDRQEKVDSVAASLGIENADAFGGLSPEEKEEKMRDAKHVQSLYLGDGANDSLAFDAAFVAGTPVVDRSILDGKADFFSLCPGLDFLPKLVAVSHIRKSAVRAAFSFAVLYNLGAVLISLSGRMSPLLAAILMPISSIVTILIVAGRFAKKV